MSWLTDFANSLKGVSTDTQSSINDIAPAFSNTGGALTEAYKASAPAEYRNIFFDSSRDTPQNAIYRNATFADQIAAGKNPFAGEGETEYNQNMAKRAAIVASIFGGAALAGGAGAGSGSTAATAGTSTVPVGGTGLAGMSSMPMAGAGAGTASGTAAAGSAGAGMGSSLAYTPAVVEAPAAASAGGASVGGLTAAEEASLLGGTAGAGKAGGGAAAAGGSWAPYAQAGGTIMSTLFSGLMQMEQQKEQLKREKQMALAKSHLEKAQAENQALDTLIRVWQGARR